MLHSMELAGPRDCGDGNISDSRIGHRGRESILTLDGNCGLRLMENVVKHSSTPTHRVDGSGASAELHTGED
jgi:hypothetical protein